MKKMISGKQSRTIFREITDSKLRDKLINFWDVGVINYVNRISLMDKALKGKDCVDMYWAEFRELNQDIVHKLDLLTYDIEDTRLIKEIKKMFRELIFPYMKKGELILRATEKPRGYPGDYKTLEAIYNHRAWTGTGIGCLWDKYMLEDDYVKSIRKRKDFTRDLIIEAMNKQGPRAIRIMNLGVGPGREVREILSSEKIINKEVSFTFMDQDRESLDFLRSKLDGINNTGTIRFNYVEKGILSFCGEVNKGTHEFENQDLIYSIGVLDYLPDGLCRSLLKAGLNLLNPGGEIIIAFKLAKKFKSLASDWFCDWTFYGREEDEIIRLVRESCPSEGVNIIIPEKIDKRIVFFIIRKV